MWNESYSFAGKSLELSAKYLLSFLDRSRLRLQRAEEFSLASVRMIMKITPPSQLAF